MFCGKCGRPLAEGEVCNCSTAIHTPAPAPKATFKDRVDSAKGFFEVLKNRMGIGDEELNKGDAYEMGKQIIPECVNANEGEVPVKQYTVAHLRNRILGIPYSKAVGRMQVTNKRVIFRAPGRCIAGRTTLQHEFAIDELAGLEARREYVFSGVDLFIGILAALVGGSAITGIIGWMCGNAGAFLMILMTMLFGAAGFLPFVFMKKKWLLKILCLGGAFMPMFTYGAMIPMINDSWIVAFFAFIIRFSAWIALAFAIFSLIIHAIRPNLVLIVKNKAAAPSVDIKRKKVLGFLNKQEEEHTGYTEVLPADGVERCIREINAMIIDIQKLGDFGIEKWKA